MFVSAPPANVGQIGAIDVWGPWLDRPVRHVRATAIVFSLIVSMSGVFAAQADAQSADSVTVRLQDALAKVLTANSKLQGQKYELAGADARRELAALRPAYEMSLDVENVLGTGQLRTFGDTEATLRLGTVLELGDKRDKRTSLADSERQLLAVEKDAERLDILAETTRRFILVLTEQERSKLALQNQQLAERTVELIKQRVAQGRASPVESNNAKLALAQAQISVQEQQATLRSAWAALSATWGAPPGASGVCIGSLFELPQPATFSVLEKAIDENPDITRFASERRVNESKLRLAEANHDPDVSAGIGVRRLQATKDQALVFSVSVPLGSAGRSGPSEREALSRIELGRYEEAAARANLIGTLYGLYEQLESARLSFGKLQDTVLPEAVQAERLTEEGFQSGRFSFLELTLARQTLLDIREQAVTKAATYHQLYLEIERLTGQSMTVSGGAQ